LQAGELRLRRHRRVGAGRVGGWSVEGGKRDEHRAHKHGSTGKRQADPQVPASCQLGAAGGLLGTCRLASLLAGGSPVGPVAACRWRAWPLA
jgi:hypothetical protein